MLAVKFVEQHDHHDRDSGEDSEKCTDYLWLKGVLITLPVNNNNSMYIVNVLKQQTFDC